MSVAETQLNRSASIQSEVDHLDLIMDDFVLLVGEANKLMAEGERLVYRKVSWDDGKRVCLEVSLISEEDSTVLGSIRLMSNGIFRDEVMVRVSVQLPDKSYKQFVIQRDPELLAAVFTCPSVIPE